MNVTAGHSNALSHESHAVPARQSFQTLSGADGWELQSRYRAQADQFDRPDTLYVLARDEQGRVNGCARLLPTIQPYLLAAAYPNLLQGQPAPCAAEVWELSRMAAMDCDQRASATLSQLPVEVTLGLLREAAAIAAAHGARQLLTMATVGMERLLRRAGLQVHRLGPPSIVDGHPLCACAITLAPRVG